MKFRRILAFMLCLVMILGILPTVPVSAAGNGGSLIWEIQNSDLLSIAPDPVGTGENALKVVLPGELTLREYLDLPGAPIESAELSFSIYIPSAGNPGLGQSGRRTAMLCLADEDGKFLIGGGVQFASSAQKIYPVIADGGNYDKGDTCGDITRDSNTGYDKWLEYHIAADLTNGTFSASIDGEEIDGSTFDAGGAAVRLGLIGGSEASTIYVKDISVNGTEVTLEAKEKTEESDETGYTPPVCSGTAPRSVTWLWDSEAADMDGQFVARFNWVTAPAVQDTYLYYAKRADFDRSGKYSKRIEGRNSLVDLSKNAVYSETDTISLEPVRSHKAETLTLEAGTEYVWCVGDGNRNVSEQGSFTTPAADIDSFDFIWITDPQTNGSSYESTLNYYESYSKRALDMAVSDFPDAAFVLSTGDNINFQFDTWQWDAYFEANEETFSQYPLYLMPGNHEYNGYPRYTGSSETIDPTLSALKGRFNAPETGAAYYGGGENGDEPLVNGLDKLRVDGSNYYFVYGDTLFLILENVDPDEVVEEQIQWMKSVVRNHPTTWTVAALHCSLFPGWRFEDWENEKPDHFAEWTEGLAAAGVDLVLMGHEHVYVRTSPMDTEDTVAADEANGTVYITNNPATNAMEYVYNKDWNFTEVWSQSYGSAYAAISIAPEKISITAKGYFKPGLGGEGEETLKTLEDHKVIKQTPRQAQLDGYTYPAAAVPAKADLDSVTVGGIAREGQTLLALTTPRTVSADWQWQASDNGEDDWTDIPGATAQDYTVTEAVVGRYLRVIAEGTGEYEGTVASAATEAVKPLHSGGENEPGYTMDLEGVSNGSLPDGWVTEQPDMICVAASPDGDGKAIKVADLDTFSAEFGFGEQRGSFDISYKLWIDTLGSYTFGPETPTTSVFTLLDSAGNEVLSHSVMTWPDCGGEFYFENSGNILGNQDTYASEGKEFALREETATGKWIDVILHFDFSAGTYTFTFGGDPIYTSAACREAVFQIPADCEDVASLRLTSGTPDAQSSVFYYKDLVIGDGGSGGSSEPTDPNRREPSEPWDRTIKEGEWTITDPGAGGAMPAIGEGPDGLLVVGGDLSGVYISDDNGLNWRNAGKVQGLEQMHVSALGFDPNDGDVFYVGTEGNLYRTEDAGKSFVPVCAPQEDLNGYWTAIAVSADGRNVYAAYNGGWNGFTSKIYVSKDGGKTFPAEDAWNIGEANGASSLLRVQKMIVPENNPQALLVLSQTDTFISWNEEGPAEAETGYYVTTDGGATWSALTGGIDALEPASLGKTDDTGYVERDMALDARDSSVVYLTDSNGIYAVRWADNTRLGSQAADNGGYVSTKATDDGKTMIRTITNSDGDPEVREIVIEQPSEISGQWTTGTYTREMAFNEGWPGDAPLAYAHGLVQSLYDPDVYYTTGTQWAFRFYENKAGDKIAEPIYTDAHGDGTFRGRGLSNVVPHMVAISPVDSNVIYGAFADIGFWYSLDGGASWSHGNDQNYSGWSPYNGGDCLFVAPDPTELGVIWAAYGNGTYYVTLLKSEDHGATWIEPANEGLSSFWWSDETPDRPGGRILSIAIDPNSDPESRTLYLTCCDAEWDLPYSVYKSEDGAENWTEISPEEYGVYMAVAVDPQNSDIVYVGAGNGLYRSEDGGATWTMAAGIPDLTGYEYWEGDNDYFGVTAIAISPVDPEVVYVSVSNTQAPEENCGIYKSVDHGKTFTKVTVDPDLDQFAACVAVHPEDPDIVFASASNVTRSGGKTPEGYFAVSVDGGATWTKCVEGLAYPTVRSIAVSASDPEIVLIGAQGMSLQMRKFDYGNLVPVERVTLDVSSKELRVGQTFTLTASVYPENATDNTLNWTSQNPEVAAVDQNGVVTAKAAGTTVITVEAGGQSASCEVSVTSAPGGSTAATLYTITVKQSAGGQITPDTVRISRNGSRTFTILADGGYTILDVLVDGRSVGAVQNYAFENVTANHTITAVFEKTEGGLPFADVAANAWYYDAVRYVHDNGIMVGVQDTRFVPNGTLSRAMVAQILYNLEGQSAVSETVFTDVQAGTWYENAVNWAAAADLVNGFGDGTFRPDSVITREQLVTILHRYAAYKAMETGAVGDLSQFADGTAVSDWAEDAVRWAVGAELLCGRSDGTLDPAGTATRAETASLLMRLFQK